MFLNRRQFLAGALGAPAPFAEKKRPAERPNVLLILADGLGAWMLGSYGNKEILTPNIDHLARAGTRFTYHYCGAPAPAAGKATLLGGRVPREVGDAGRNALSKVLAAQGYECESAGGAQALDFLDKAVPGKRFFLIAAYPLMAEEPAQKYLDLYAASKFDTLGWEPASSSVTAGKERFADVTSSLRRFSASISAFDDRVLAVLNKLRQRGLGDDTLVILTSTTGSLMGRHGLWTDGLGSNPPNMYEEVVKVPMIWSWPGRVPAEGVRPECVAAYDLVPTLCDLISVTPPGGLCGRSYAPLATGKPLPAKGPWRNLVFGQLGDVSMVRDARCKLVIRNQGKGPNELYDLVQDARERVNAYENPQYVTVRDRLLHELTGWQKKCV